MTDILLFENIDEPGLATREVYERRGGYSALRKALEQEPMRDIVLRLTWQGEVYTNQHTAPTGAFPAGSELPTAGGYVVHRVMAAYQYNRSLRLQLNVNNLFDKQYLARVRTQRLAWATPGEARSIVLSANLSF